MFSALVVACVAGVSEPTPQDCQALFSRTFFETEEACKDDIIDNASPWVETQGYVVQEAQCVPVKLFTPTF